MSNFFSYLKSSNSSSIHKKKALLKNFEEERDVGKFVEIAAELGLGFTEKDFEGLPIEKAYLDLLLRLGLAPWKLVFQAVISAEKEVAATAVDIIKSHFKARFQSDDIQWSVDLLPSLSDQSFLAGWSMIMYSYGPNLHKTEMMNHLLHQIESYFSSPAIGTRATAFKAWKYLIYNLNIQDHIMTRGRIKLLLIPIWNALVHEPNAVVREEAHSALAYIVALISSKPYPAFFRDFCLPLQGLAITDKDSISLLASILLKVIDNHGHKNVDALVLLDEGLEQTLNSINSCHVYQSWNVEDIQIAQGTLSILENPLSTEIYKVLVRLAQHLIDNPTEAKVNTTHIQFLIKFCTDRISNPCFNSYVSSFLTLEPKSTHVKQVLDGLNSLSHYVPSGTKLKVDLVSKIKKLNRILVSNEEIPVMKTASKDSSATPSKRKIAFVPLQSKRPLTERQSEPRSETLHNMYNSMAQIDTPVKENRSMLKENLEKVVQCANDLDTMEKSELVRIQADLVSLLSVITQKLLQ